MFIKLKVPHGDWLGAYNYVLDQKRHPGAHILPYASSTAGRSVAELVREQEWHATVHDPTIEKPVYTCYITYAPEDREAAMNPEVREEVARRVLDSMGVDTAQQPVTVVTHYEKDHIHDHIIVNRIRADGRIWNPWNRALIPQVREQARELEVRFGFRRLDVDEAPAAVEQAEREVPAEAQAMPAEAHATTAVGMAEVPEDVTLPEVLPEDAAVEARDGASAKLTLRRAVAAAMRGVVERHLPTAGDRLAAFEEELMTRGLGMDVSVESDTGRIQGYAVYLRGEDGDKAPFPDGRPAVWSLSGIGFRGPRAAHTLLGLPDHVAHVGQSPRRTLVGTGGDGAPPADREQDVPASAEALIIAASQRVAGLRSVVRGAYAAHREDWRGFLVEIQKAGLQLFAGGPGRDWQVRRMGDRAPGLPLASLGIDRQHPLRALIAQAVEGKAIGAGVPTPAFESATTQVATPIRPPQQAPTTETVQVVPVGKQPTKAAAPAPPAPSPASPPSIDAVRARWRRAWTAAAKRADPDGMALPNREHLIEAAEQEGLVVTYNFASWKVRDRQSFELLPMEDVITAPRERNLMQRAFQQAMGRLESGEGGEAGRRPAGGDDDALAARLAAKLAQLDRPPPGNPDAGPPTGRALLQALSDQGIGLAATAGGIELSDTGGGAGGSAGSIPLRRLLPATSTLATRIAKAVKAFQQAQTIDAQRATDRQKGISRDRG